MTKEQSHEGDHNSPSEIRIDEERRVYENRFGALYDDRVTFPSGAQGTYIRFVWNAPYYVAVLPVLPDGGIVLVRAFRHALRDWCIEVPKGFGRSGVEPDDVAHEELTEETGFACDRIEPRGTVITDPAFVATPCHLFRAALTGVRHPTRHESTEAIQDCLVHTPADVRRLVETGALKDAITRLLLEAHLRETGAW